jgi:two-component system, OmpR family, sensor histidine kinase MprB
VRTLPLRANIALLCAATVAVAIVAGSVLAWTATRHTLREQVDASLGQRVVTSRIAGTSTTTEPFQLQVDAFEHLCDPPPPGLEEAPIPSIQVIRSDRTSCSPGSSGDEVTPSVAEYAIAQNGAGSVLRDATTQDGEHVRSLTTPAGNGYAIRVTRSLEEVDATMRELAVILAIAAALGVLLAAAAGLWVARVVLRPVGRLTSAAEHVAETEDLDVPIVVTGRDEVARLSTAFNAMTARLAGSRARQRQLISDASHELRTPLTSLRTHVEWLMRADDRGRPLKPREKRQVEQAVLGQIDELSALIGELGALARDEPVREHVEVDLDQVVLRAVERAQRRDPNRRLVLVVEPMRVRGDAAALERAVLNLLDNALKFSEGPIEVTLRAGRLSVTDRGPGLAGADQAHAFERFWRAPEARELPGSGLGLAIVADSVAAHGGTVFFEDAAHGGATVGFALPNLTELSATPA